MTAHESSSTPLSAKQLRSLADRIKAAGRDLGFDEVAITDTDLSRYKVHLQTWLERGMEGEMGYMRRNLEKRLNPEALEPGTARVITARMNYLSEGAQPIAVLADPSKAYVARYALGRDYHKVVRKRLAGLARLIQQEADDFGNYRAFTTRHRYLKRHWLRSRASDGLARIRFFLIGKRVLGFFWVKCSPICHCRWMLRALMRLKIYAGIAAPA